jgi:hypothetical protein
MSSSNIDLYLQHMTRQAQRERSAGFRSLPIVAQDHIEPDVVPTDEKPEEDSE